MTTLSTAAWAAHDVGLAASIGGTLFGRAALQPALHEITSPMERDRVSAGAWQRFSLVNLIAHGTMAAAWFAGRRMLTGREVTGKARSLTIVKDGLIVASLITGIGSMLFGRKLGKRSVQRLGPEEVRERANIQNEGFRTRKLQRAVSGLGLANLAANIGIMAVTAALAMEASKSVRFPAWSKRLP